MEALKTFLNSNPTLARWSDEVGRRAAQVDLEHAKSIPDLRVGAGVRQFNENDLTAIVASVAIPLPIFDRNDGNIAAAESRLAKAETDALAVRDELLRALIEAVGELEVAGNAAQWIEARRVCPSRRRPLIGPRSVTTKASSTSSRMFSMFSARCSRCGSIC